jgi:hypothetical protein
VPTIDDLLNEYMARPDVVERVESLRARYDGLLRALSEVCEHIGVAIRRVAESPPSPGYEPMLIKCGFDPILARMMARLLVRTGTRIENDSKRLRTVVGAIRFLAKPGRRRRALSRRAEVLLTAWEETSVIETIFDDAGLDVFEFVELLKSVAEGDEAARRRITKTAALVAPHLPSPRGRKVTAASAAHEFLLEEGVGVTGSRSYTWDPNKEDFTDPLTAATRLEFACPRFSPRPAYRRLKARRRASIV